MLPRPTEREVRQSVLVITIGFTVLYLFFHAQWMAVMAVAVAVAGLFVPALARMITTAWLGLAHALGRVNAFVLLSLVFFLIVTPLAWVRRVLGRDGFHAGERTGSTWVARDHRYTAGDLEKPW